jgi:hypothetical protein
MPEHPLCGRRAVAPGMHARFRFDAGAVPDICGDGWDSDEWKRVQRGECQPQRARRSLRFSTIWTEMEVTWQKRPSQSVYLILE